MNWPDFYFKSRETKTIGRFSEAEETKLSSYKDDLTQEEILE